MPFLEQLRFPHMSTEKLKKLSMSGNVPSELLFEALFSKLSSEATLGIPALLLGADVSRDCQRGAARECAPHLLQWLHRGAW
eukprot:symbB.v1.2.002324.t1/scaffold123.1/size315817/9